MRITDHNAQLWLQWPPPGPTSKLIHLGSGAFAAELEPDVIRVRFDASDRSGVVRKATILMAGMYWYGQRVQ